jgi:NAD(P)-dependent dehydrogenase (short-subunit alcohol dehydrogenase family)
MKIQDSTVLVTGANRGIGKAFAEALLDRGAAVVYAAVRDVATVTDPRLVPIQLDVTDPDRVAAVARELDDSSWSSTTPGSSTSASRRAPPSTSRGWSSRPTTSAWSR